MWGQRATCSVLSFHRVGGRNRIRLSNLVAGPCSLWAISVAHRACYLCMLLVAVTSSLSSSVAFVTGRLHNTVLVKMLVNLCKSSKLHPRARSGGVPLIIALVGQTLWICGRSLWIWRQPGRHSEFCGCKVSKKHQHPPPIECDSQSGKAQWGGLLSETLLLRVV